MALYKMELFGENYYGRVNEFRHCKKAHKSFLSAIEKIPPNRQAAVKRGLERIIQRIADENARVSREKFPPEGDLPNNVGKFHAIKHSSIRGYVWRSKRLANTFFISHWVYKNYQKLDSIDTDKVCSNWYRIEEEGNES